MEKGQSHLALQFDSETELWRAQIQQLFRIEGLALEGVPNDARVHAVCVGGQQVYPLGLQPISVQMYERLCVYAAPAFGTGGAGDWITVELRDASGLAVGPDVSERETGQAACVALWGTFVR